MALSSDMDEFGSAYDKDTGLDSLDTANPEFSEANFWSLEATLHIENEAVVPSATTINVSYWAQDQLLCTDSIVIDNDNDGLADVYNVSPSEPTDTTLDLFASWSLNFGPATNCSSELTSPLLLGIGSLDSQIIPSVISAGLTPDTLNGLYVQQDPTDPVLYVFGAIGTQAQFNGEANPLTNAPIPDGDYLIRTLYLLPLINN
jgi:hypothetical protein